jgi:hypothetical protein
MGSASAATFGFQNIFPVDKPSESSIDAYVQFFTMDVTQYSPTEVLFKINHLAGTPSGSFIGTVYFDGSLGAATVDVNNVGTVDFASNGAANFPQGNKISFSTDYSATAENGDANKYAVQAGESLGISFVGSLSTVLNAILGGTLRVGLHVQGIGTAGDSDAIYNRRVAEVLPSVPIPAALPLLASGLGALGFVGWRRRRKAERIA